MSNRTYYEIPRNTTKYFAKNVKYQDILKNSKKYLEIYGNTLIYQEIPREIMKN
jgi:hypothetical protein